jgi:hypothetical protein
MRRKYAQVRDLKNGKEEVRDFYNSAVDYFSKEFKIPKKDFPKLRFVSGEYMAYNQVDNEVSVGDEEFISNMGDSIGEELGHYVRAKLKGRVGKEVEKKEAHSDEFYGFLGSKALYRASGEKQKEEFFSNGERTFETDYGGKTYPEMRKEILKRAKEKGLPRLRRKFREAEKSGDEAEMKRIYQEAEKSGYGKYEKNLIHVRPYHFASDTDLDKVENLKRLYSLSDKSVRRRFFRESKLYDIDKGIKKETRRRKGLEGKLAILFFSSLFLSFLFSQNKITGNVIGNEEFSSNPISLIFLGLALCLGGLLIYRLITKK